MLCDPFMSWSCIILQPCQRRTSSWEAPGKSIHSHSTVRVLSHTQNPVLFYWMLKMLFNSSKKKVIHDSIHFSISRDLDSQLLQISLEGSLQILKTPSRQRQIP